ESESEAAAAPPSEEADQRRPPVVARTDDARIPRPAEVSPVPASVMIWSPAERIVAQPGPAVVIFVNPPALAIRSPSRLNGRHPHISVCWIVLPAAVCIELLGTVNIRADVLRTRAHLLQSPVTIRVKAIPFILRNRRDNHELGIVRIAASL